MAADPSETLLEIRRLIDDPANWDDFSGAYVAHDRIRAILDAAGVPETHKPWATPGTCHCPDCDATG